MWNHLRSIELRQNKCIDTFVGKSMAYVSRTCTRNRCNNQNIYLENLLASNEEIDYFTFSNNNDAIPKMLPKTRRFQIPFLSWHAPRRASENALRWVDTDRNSRYADVDCFYLCQTYAKIPKHLIRDNANLLILFKQDGTNLKHIYDDHVNIDMSYKNFCELCRCC